MRLVTFLEGHERRERLALEFVRLAHHRRLGHRRVIHQRALHLHGADAVAGDVEHVVHPAEDPPVAVVVELGAVAGEVAAGEPAPVGLPVARVVAVDGAQHPRPRLGERQEAAALGDRAALLRPPARAVMPGKGIVAEPGLVVTTPGSGVIMIAAGLGLPPGVHDRAALAADVLVVPDPRLGIDRLADACRAAAGSRGRAAPGCSVPHFMKARIAVGAV